MARRQPCGLILAGIAAFSISACNTTTVESFQKAENSVVSEAWFKPDVDFSKFDRLWVQPLEIFFADGLGEPNPDDLAGIRQRFRQAFEDQIAGDYEIVQAAGDDVLLIRASLVDMKVNRGIGGYTGRGRTASLVTAGQLTLFMEFSDSVTGEVLARAADQERPADEPFAGEDASWQEVRAAADRWAGLLRNFLDARVRGT